MKTFACFLVWTALALFPASPSARADQKVIVHEWGTFTCLQDEQGHAIGGINVDDEPVPYFVDSVALGVAPQYGSNRFSVTNLGLPPYGCGKGWISGDPRVTMRLETPVIYIYPPPGQKPESIPPLDVHVDFHGGVLSQFYPHADFSGLPLLQYPGEPQFSNRFPYVDKNAGITEATTTSLDWKGVQLGSTEKPIDIDDPVWTTPREVSAPVLQVKFSAPDFGHPGKSNDYVQAEHFLFYRGVGHLDSPVYLTRDAFNAGSVDRFYVWPSWFDQGSQQPTLGGEIALDANYSKGWLAEIRSDGSCAFRVISSFQEGDRSRVHPLADFSSKFELSDFGADNLTKLKSSMHDALVKEGLYDDEATAMLKTWELSYFKSPGLRFFYIVPRAWVDQVLPLKINGPPTDITRVMVGRIELITEAQKAALARLSTGPCPDLAAIKKAAFDVLEKGHLTEEQRQPFYTGEKPLSDLGLTIPPLVQDYLSLGRFRDALIVREDQQHPSAALAQFIKNNQLVPQD